MSNPEWQPLEPGGYWSKSRELAGGYEAYIKPLRQSEWELTIVHAEQTTEVFHLERDTEREVKDAAAVWEAAITEAGRVEPAAEEVPVKGCSCGMADYGAPGHDGGPPRPRMLRVVWTEATTYSQEFAVPDHFEVMDRTGSSFRQGKYVGSAVEDLVYQAADYDKAFSGAEDRTIEKWEWVEP